MSKPSKTKPNPNELKLEDVLAGAVPAAAKKIKEAAESVARGHVINSDEMRNRVGYAVSRFNEVRIHPCLADNRIMHRGRWWWGSSATIASAKKGAA